MEAKIIAESNLDSIKKLCTILKFRLKFQLLNFNALDSANLYKTQNLKKDIK